MIEPILDNLLLKPLDAEEVSKSGIYRPEGVKEKPSIGEILAVGPNVKSHVKPIKESPGRKYKAVYKKWLGNEIKYEGETYILVAEKDVLGIIK